jgi:DNA transposition AAA+ family ATPase
MPLDNNNGSEPESEIAAKLGADPLALKKILSICIHHPRMTEILERIDACRLLSKAAPEPDCLLIIGPSGVGKTTLTTLYTQRYPRTLTAKGTRVLVLYARIPVPATTKNMATKLLERLGDPICEKGSLDAQTRRLTKLVKDAEVELVILDEFQHFIDPDRELVLRAVSDWLKNFISDTGIPVILTGLPQCRRVLDANEQLLRRFSAQEHLEPFNWHGSGKADFRRFLSQVDEALPLSQRSGLADGDLARRIYAASLGNIAQVMKIVRGAARIAASSGSQNISNEMLAKAYAKYIVPKGEKNPNPFLESWDGEILTASADEKLKTHRKQTRERKTKPKADDVLTGKD